MGWGERERLTVKKERIPKLSDSKIMNPRRVLLEVINIWNYPMILFSYSPTVFSMAHDIISPNSQ